MKFFGFEERLDMEVIIASVIQIDNVCEQAAEDFI
jgi:hypothetical protein